MIYISINLALTNVQFIIFIKYLSYHVLFYFRAAARLLQVYFSYPDLNSDNGLQCMPHLLQTLIRTAKELEESNLLHANHSNAKHRKGINSKAKEYTKQKRYGLSRIKHFARIFNQRFPQDRLGRSSHEFPWTRILIYSLGGPVGLSLCLGLPGEFTMALRHLEIMYGVSQFRSFGTCTSTYSILRTCLRTAFLGVLG